MPERRQVNEIKGWIGMAQTPTVDVRAQLREIRSALGLPVIDNGINPVDFRAQEKELRASLGMSLVDSNPATVNLSPGF